MAFEALKNWTPAQKHVVAASFLGWMLDAFDFFLLVFVIPDIAKEFKVGVPAVTIAVTLTLALRPVGAFIFGRLADRYGRKPVLMADVVIYAVLAFASAFAPSLMVLIVLRALFGVAMGGEWGLGASLTMETVRPESRGTVSGILQTGYASGYLVAALVYGTLFPVFGWRGVFMVGLVPALLVLYVRRHVPESPSWQITRGGHVGIGSILARHWRLAVYSVLLMTCLNFLSHGTQDLYPTFLKVQHHQDAHSIRTIAVIYNVGAILGGLIFGALSQHIGRRRTLIAAALLALPVIPFWAFSQSIVGLAAGAFVMQFMVQGCWGVIPAHLNELSPPEARGTFPGFVYQLGNFLASANATLQAVIAVNYGQGYGTAMALVAAIAAVAIVFFAVIGNEARETDFAALAEARAAPS
jgi:SHS family lactate transporter-like MFS transporter